MSGKNFFWRLPSCAMHIVHATRWYIGRCEKLFPDREGALTFTLSGLLPSSATWRCDWNDVDGGQLVMWQRGWRHHGGNWNGTTSLVEVWSSRRQRRERKPPWLQHKQGKTSSSRKKQAKVNHLQLKRTKSRFPQNLIQYEKPDQLILKQGPSFHFGIKNTY